MIRGRTALLGTHRSNHFIRNTSYCTPLLLKTFPLPSPYHIFWIITQLSSKVYTRSLCFMGSFDKFVIFSFFLIFSFRNLSFFHLFSVHNRPYIHRFHSPAAVCFSGHTPHRFRTHHFHLLPVFPFFLSSFLPLGIIVCIPAISGA